MATKSRQRLARFGESMAAAFLKECGLRLIHRNLHSPLGEIDLVCRDEGQRPPQWVFVEVRTYRSLRFGRPEESLSSQKRRRLARLAQQFLLQAGQPHAPYRLDAITIFWPVGAARPQLQHWPGLS